MKINLMKRTRYRSFFLLPVGTRKVLHDCGWIFETEHRIAPSVVAFLEEKLSLQKLESHSGLDTYLGDDIKVDIFFDKNGLAEEIYIRLYGVWDYALLRDTLCSTELRTAVLFDPNHALSSKVPL
jgi:hypothetical protein